MKLYRYRRIIAIVAVAGIATVGIGAVKQSPPKMQETEYIVKPNDTLWHIARQYTSDEEDIREVVYDIRRDNNIGNILPTGTKLLIKKEMPDAATSDIPPIK